MSQEEGRNLKMSVIAIIQLLDCIWFFTTNLHVYILKGLIFHMRRWKFTYVKSSPKVTLLANGQTWARLLASPPFSPVDYLPNYTISFLIIPPNNLVIKGNFMMFTIFFLYFLNMSIYGIFAFNCSWWHYAQHTTLSSTTF